MSATHVASVRALAIVARRVVSVLDIERIADVVSLLFQYNDSSKRG